MTKRLVVCCDGTWNTPDQPGGAPTNVTKVALGVASKHKDGGRQLVHYQKGVGTRRFERVRGGALGVGLSRNVKDCYRFLVESYEPDDRLYLFGFSRGAFTARSLAGLVRNSGILRADHADRVDEAYGLYRSRADQTHPKGVESHLFRRTYSHEDPGIWFLGVWDTVGSLGVPVRIPLVSRRWEFHDTTLSGRVRFAYHALAIDERRGPFKPTLWERGKEISEQTLEQVWFAGVHSDVGGGYPEPELAEVPLLWMVTRASAAGLTFLPGHFQLTPGADDDEPRRVGEQIAPDALGKIHESLKGPYLAMPRHRRPLMQTDGGSVASSAVRRMHEQGDYSPPKLGEYLTAKPKLPETEVRDRP